MSRPGGRGLTVAVTVLGLTAGGLGWFGPELGAALPDQSEPMVTVTIAGPTSLSENGGVRHLAMTADVANLGTGPVRLLRLATEIPSLTTTTDLTADRPLPPRSVTRISLSARLDCGGATPLRLPPLELRDGTGVTFRRVVTGSSQEFLTECALDNLDAPPAGLRLVDFRTSGDQLVLSLATFGQRPLRLLTVASGGLLLAATPAPVMLFPTLERQVRLDPASSCSADWAVSGPSGQLDLTLDWGPDPTNPETESDPFRVEVQTGALGAEWLMGHSCSGWVR